MNLLALFFLFMYIGLSTIGGGLVSISLMQQELLSRNLISPEKFIEMIAVSESTPGPIGINMATYIGYELYGIFGSIVLTAGIVLPSLITIIIIARFSTAIQHHLIVKRFFYGLRAGAAGMIAAAAWNVFSVAILTLPLVSQTDNWLNMFDWKAFLLFFCFIILQTRYDKLHPAIFVLLGAISGVTVF